MEEIQGYPCPHCGFDPRSVKGIEYALPMGTILAGNYLVGRVLGQGGFGITISVLRKGNEGAAGGVSGCALRQLRPHSHPCGGTEPQPQQFRRRRRV